MTQADLDAKGLERLNVAVPRGFHQLLARLSGKLMQDRGARIPTGEVLMAAVEAALGRTRHD